MYSVTDHDADEALALLEQHRLGEIALNEQEQITINRVLDAYIDSGALRAATLDAFQQLTERI